jgi:predicted XRE-type DNA-binding protein
MIKLGSPFENLGPDNVFADFSLPNPEERAMRAALVSRVCDVATKRKLSYAKVAKLIGMPKRR